MKSCEAHCLLIQIELLGPASDGGHAFKSRGGLATPSTLQEQFSARRDRSTYGNVQACLLSQEERDR